MRKVGRKGTLHERGVYDLPQLHGENLTFGFEAYGDGGEVHGSRVRMAGGRACRRCRVRGGGCVGEGCGGRRDNGGVEIVDSDKTGGDAGGKVGGEGNRCREV